MQVPYTHAQKIKAYIQATLSPTTNFIFRGTLFNTPRSPKVAPLSSRGSNIQSWGILKPYTIGPGVNVVARVPKIEDTEFPPNVVMPKFDTSMDAPHLIGIAALIKNVHPTQSPMAIKSALMTTTETIDN